MRTRTVDHLVVAIAFFFLLAWNAAGARPFTPSDDVELARFRGLTYWAHTPIRWSPDGRYFLALSERGRLDLNAPESTLWLFTAADVRKYLEKPEGTPPPQPRLLASIANNRDGGSTGDALITRVGWTDDSSSIAFLALQKSSRYRYHRLFRVDVSSGKSEALTPEDEDVTEFDLRGSNYVYIVQAPELLKHEVQGADEYAAADPIDRQRVLNFFSSLSALPRLDPFPNAGLWAVIDGQRFQVRDEETGAPLALANIYEEYVEDMKVLPDSLSLSPDSRQLVAIAAIDEEPAGWSRYKRPDKYPPPDFKIRPVTYQLIDLKRGKMAPLVDAPAGWSKSWNSHAHTARWSADGRSLLLSNTFLPLDGADPRTIADRESHPSIAVLRLDTHKLSAVFGVKAGLDKERYGVSELRFQDARTLIVDFELNFHPGLPAAAVFKQQASGSWKRLPAPKRPLEVTIRQDINHPPVLAVDDANGGGRVLFDPNPQLEDVTLSEAERIHWRSPTGSELEAILVKPVSVVRGQRYPLVIQTHGYGTYFLSSGSMNAGFAARALAAHGFAVVQMGWDASRFGTPEEGPDQAAAFVSLIRKLSDDGLVDPARVGAIGFSRSVYHVLETLTHEPHALAAASVTDGVDFSYFTYLMAGDAGGGTVRINGGLPPVGERGLKAWMENAPGFNMNKVTAPLLLLEPGWFGVLFGAWEHYVALDTLHKPVDLIMLPPGTHPMTNPQQRLSAQTINVDWFRFWLKGEEDPAPEKMAQYQRWRELRSRAAEER